MLEDPSDDDPKSDGPAMCDEPKEESRPEPRVDVPLPAVPKLDEPECDKEETS